MVSGTPTPTPELAMLTLYWLLPPFIEQTFKGYVVPSSVGCWDVRYNGESSNHVGSPISWSSCSAVVYQLELYWPREGVLSAGNLKTIEKLTESQSAF